MSIKDEDSFDPITIDSKGNIDSVPAMTPGSLKSALETLVKYAKMLEEADAKKTSQEAEEDVPNKD